jgi:hypothetical protein
MSRSSFNVFESVIGFEHKDVATVIVEDDGTIRHYKGGIRSTCTACETKQISPKECNPKWFTNFNQALLDKIRDYHKNNL